MNPAPHVPETEKPEGQLKICVPAVPNCAAEEFSEARLEADAGTASALVDAAETASVASRAGDVSVALTGSEAAV